MTTVPYDSKRSAAALVERIQTQAGAPMRAMIEIADRCNETCVHCYQVQGQKGEMSTEEIKGLLDELADMGVLFLTLSGGEPTLRSDFLEIVEHARHRKFAVKIFSNGLRITPELAARLGELAVQEVQMSLYSHRPEVHDRVTGVAGSHAKTVAAARALLHVGIAVVLKAPLMTHNSGQHEEFVALVSSIGADYMMSPDIYPKEDGDLETTRLRVEDDAHIEADRALRRGRRPLGEAPHAPLDKSVCAACRGNVHIEANGEMRPCALLTVPVGDALTDGVATAFRNNEEARFIRQLTWADIHGCRDCDLRAWCHRCFSRAQMEAGDAMAPYAAACRTARLEYELCEGRPARIEPGIGARTDVGPYQRIGDGRFRVAQDVRTADDDAIAARHRWVRPAERLVQLRRPAEGAAEPATLTVLAFDRIGRG